MSEPCDRCGGRGWVAVEDPLHPGELAEARCPDCTTRQAIEGDPGCHWADFGWWPQPDGPKRLLSWNADTCQLAFWPLDKVRPVVLAVIKDEAEVRRRLDGWAEHNTTKGGLAWLAQRLEGCR